VKAFDTAKTRMIELPYGEKTVIKMEICSLVSTEYTNVTDIQTDGRTGRHRTTAYAALMHSIALQKSTVSRELKTTRGHLMPCSCTFIRYAVAPAVGPHGGSGLTSIRIFCRILFPLAVPVAKKIYPNVTVTSSSAGARA